MAEEQVVLFRLGKEEYAISITQVKEIIHHKGATQLPDMPGYVEGIISLRGTIIPVVDLAMRLGLITSRNGDKRILVIEMAGREIGIIVDEVTEVIRLQENAIEPPPLATVNGYIRGIGKEGTRLLILVDIEKLFDEEELQELKKVG
jgi:purine-binding chemotaxis protein CheW